MRLFFSRNRRFSTKSLIFTAILKIWKLLGEGKIKLTIRIFAWKSRLWNPGAKMKFNKNLQESFPFSFFSLFTFYTLFTFSLFSFFSNPVPYITYPVLHMRTAVSRVVRIVTVWKKSKKCTGKIQIWKRNIFTFFIFHFFHLALDTILRENIWFFIGFECDAPRAWCPRGA